MRTLLQRFVRDENGATAIGRGHDPHRSVPAKLGHPVPETRRSEIELGHHRADGPGFLLAVEEGVTSRYAAATGCADLVEHCPDPARTRHHEIFIRIRIL